MLDRFYASQWAKRRQQKLEHRVLSLADVVTTVSMSWAKELRKTLSTPVHCITNGFDAKDFDQYTYRKGNNFVISHVGIINSYRNSEHLLAALVELCSDLYGFKEKFAQCKNVALKKNKRG
jgi:glycosyltransferase involved in cell wall biosynthesis